MMTFCKHYRAAADHDACAAGIRYITVRGESVDGTTLPCFDNGQHLDCALRQMPTPDEIEAERREIAKAITAWAENLMAGICPHCGSAIEQKEQVGRCVYARPCGCRLYQGQLSEDE